MMIYCASSLFLLAVCNLNNGAAAFQIHSTTAPAVSFYGTSTTRLQAAYVEASEWYSPPVAAVVPSVPRPGPGLKALQTFITTVDEFEAFLASDDDRLTIVKFYASWCKSCAKFGIKLDRLASEQADWVSKQGEVAKKGTIRIVHVEYGTAKELCQAKQITKLPTVHMYVKGKKLQDFSCPPSQFYKVQELTAAYLSNPNLAASTTASFEETLQAGESMIETKLPEAPVHPVPLYTATSQPTIHAASAAVVAAGVAPTAERKRFWSRFRRARQ